MLLIHFFNLARIFRTDTAQPQPENAKRIQRVQAFFASADSMQQLKRAVLGLRISQIAVSLSGLKKQDDIPLLVRFGKKEVQRRGCEELRKIILLLDEDMDLRRTDAIVHLLVTTIQLFLRFAPYQDYPMAGWQLTAKYNEDSYLLKIEEFLQMDASALDTGFFLPLRNDAQKQGNYSDQINFMLSQEVQTLLTQFIEAAPGSSLKEAQCWQAVGEKPQDHECQCSQQEFNITTFFCLPRCTLETFKGEEKGRQENVEDEFACPGSSKKSTTAATP